MEDIKFKFNTFIEKDNSYTLSLEDIDIAVNSATFDEALNLLVSDFKEYCLEYYENIDFWQTAPNRKEHLKFVMRALSYKTNEELKNNFDDVVIVNQEGWSAIQETSYLLSIPGMKESILDADKTPLDECKEAKDIG